MDYFAIIGAIMLELLCSIIVISGLVEKERIIPVVWAIFFVIVTTGYILFVPAEWVNGCYLLTLLYVKVGYEISWKDGLITVILSVLLAGIVELICFFPFAFVFNGKWSESVNNLFASMASVLLCYGLVKKVPIRYLKKWCEKKES